MKPNKVIGFALFLVMAVLALWLADGRFTWRKVFRAQSSFVLCDSAVTTNAAGKMVLPQCRRKTGTYQSAGEGQALTIQLNDTVVAVL